MIDAQFSQREDNRFLEVTLRSGRHEYLHRGDLVSGAIIAGIVERAKETAIKRAISSPEPTGLTVNDFVEALNVEYKQNDIFPPNDITEDWLKLVDYDPENVVKLSPREAAPRRAKRDYLIVAVMRFLTKLLRYLEFREYSPAFRQVLMGKDYVKNPQKWRMLQQTPVVSLPSKIHPKILKPFR